MEKLFTTPYQSAPFSKFSSEDYLNEIRKALSMAREEVEQISTNPCSPTFENTIEALSFSGEYLERISAMFFNLNNAETNEILQQQAQEISPLLSDFQNDIYQNEKLFQRIKFVFENHSPQNAEQKTLLEQTYKKFERNGANLSTSDKEKLREIDKNLSVKKLQFSQNVLAQTNAFELHLTQEEDLAGLPDFLKELARETAQQKGKNGWIFTLDFPSFVPFVTYSSRRDLRQKMFIANATKCFSDGENDNKKLIIEIANLRKKRALLLGYKSHADFVLQERMAQSPENVLNFLTELLEKALPQAKKQLKELQDFAYAEDKISDFQKWDTAYYGEKLKQKKFQLNDQLLKPYFELNNVLNGIFEISKKLYGLHFEEINEIDVYNTEVKTFKITDENGTYKALLYTDFHPRKGKRNGAWMTSFKNQYQKNGENSRPHISIVCNFTRPTQTLPSLLTFNEVTTLFHEFGHALHGILADTKYPNLSGTSVFWDFVELPSQIMENWCFEKQALSLFAKHYQTGQDIPIEFIEQIKKSATHLEGLQTLRQLSFGLLDMAWHTNPITDTTNIELFEKQAIKDTEIYPEIPNICTSTSFSHIFSGGYSAGYYSYKWAEVLDADAFELFTEKGIFDPKTAQNFKDFILSKGGTEPPMDLYFRFRGKKPSVDALLKRAGLI